MVAVILAGMPAVAQEASPSGQATQQQQVKVQDKNKSNIPARYDVTQIGQRGIGKGIREFNNAKANVQQELEEGMKEGEKKEIPAKK